MNEIKLHLLFWPQSRGRMSPPLRCLKAFKWFCFTWKVNLDNLKTEGWCWGREAAQRDSDASLVMRCAAVCQAELWKIIPASPDLTFWGGRSQQAPCEAQTDRNSSQHESIWCHQVNTVMTRREQSMRAHTQAWEGLISAFSDGQQL